MVWQEMGVRWTSYRIGSYYFMLLIFGLGIRGCISLDSEGVALLEFQARVFSDPYDAFASWNPNDHNPCWWSGVQCVDGKVHMLDLSGFSLEGVLAPELGKLTHLRSLVLSNNCFSGAIPKEFGHLKVLEVLDLRDNDLTGTIPAEIGELRSLKHLLLEKNKFEGSVPLELGNLSLLSELQLDENLTSAVASGIGCLNRKFGQCIWQSGLISLKKANSFIVAVNGYFNNLPLFQFGKASLHSSDDCCEDFPAGSPELHLTQNILINNVRRRLVGQSSVLAAAPANGGSLSDQIIALPSSRSSGSFPAALKRKSPPAAPPVIHPPQIAPNTLNPYAGQSSGSNTPGGEISNNAVKYIVRASCFALLLIVATVVLLVFQKQAAKTIRPWKTGLSGQLQKAFVTGVPKLNRSELETACEDFSNIIHTFDGCTVYKGTLSSGVEIAVASTMINSLKDWPKYAERAYRKKVDTLSRLNHKNFVNLIGYCVEEEPFFRIMVFEYAPNGSLSEHLHVKEVEHLDWSTRTRVIMGTTYCLKYMHELNPPVAHSDLNSNTIFLTDDYAAKIADVGFLSEYSGKLKISGETSSVHSELPPAVDPETNVYSFGILLLEIISGKLPYSEEHGNLVNWAAEYLNDRQRFSCMIDPTLKSFKMEELEIICEVIHECIQQDARQRPTMNEITSKLRGVLDISPDAAVPRLSPLWWAELEILSSEAT